ncbi:hypothetical protein OAT72_05305 [Alphaproteobacteria bacterium]|nr:hypothetical protein [Alphaproteobacteria bacterium]
MRARKEAKIPGRLTAFLPARFCIGDAGQGAAASNTPRLNGKVINIVFKRINA